MAAISRLLPWVSFDAERRKRGRERMKSTLSKRHRLDTKIRVYGVEYCPIGNGSYPLDIVYQDDGSSVPDSCFARRFNAQWNIEELEFAQSGDLRNFLEGFVFSAYRNGLSA